jgi:small ligand-binding sensory domain FIST
MSSAPVNAEPVTRFRSAHASHPDWRVATERCLVELEAQLRQPRRARRGRLGVLYLSDHHVEHASEIHAFMKVRTGVLDWIGSVGVAIAADAIEYVDEPAIAVMLLDLPPDSCRVFTSLAAMPTLVERTSTGAIAASSALLHVDPDVDDLQERLPDIVARLDSRWLAGAMSSSRSDTVQIANRTLVSNDHGGLSGVTFASDVMTRARLTHACYPLRRSGQRAPVRRIDRCDGNRLLVIDGRPALDVMLEDLGAPRLKGVAKLGPWLQENLPDGGLHAGLARDPESLRERFDSAVMSAVIAVDPSYRSIAVGSRPTPGQGVVFCARDVDSARADLVRICTELREEIENDAPALAITVTASPDEAVHGSDRIRGAIYLSCAARGERLFGRRHEELEIIRRQLGDVPLIGFFASAEIAGGDIQSQTAVLTLFA